MNPLAADVKSMHPESRGLAASKGKQENSAAEGRSPLEIARSEWLAEVGEWLKASTAERAHEMRVKGHTTAAPDRSELVDLFGGRKLINKWHAARAVGIERKWERIDKCREADGFVRASCSVGCENHGKSRPIGCGHRECPKCRKAKAKGIKANLRRGRISLQETAKERKCDRSIRSRFMTLTAPHYEAKDGECATRRRIRVIYEAWRPFSRWLAEYMASKTPHTDIVHHFRVFEWTDGDDGLGHPHFHIWLHSPYLNQDLVHSQWAHCLETVSGERRVCALPDIKLANSKMEQELVKYMLKDLADDKEWQFVPPHIVAHLQTEMIGRRIRQTSRCFSEWVALAKKREVPPVCLCCGLAFQYDFVKSDPFAPLLRCTNTS